MYVARNRKGAIPASHSNHVACFTRLANHAVEWQGTQDYFVEGGCCSDTTYIYLEGKKLQHSALKSALRSSGHDVILTYTGILGFFGSTDTGNLKTLMTLGIEYAAAKSLFRKTHQHTVTCTLNLNKNCTYRQLHIELSIHAKDYRLPPTDPFPDCAFRAAVSACLGSDLFMSSCSSSSMVEMGTSSWVIGRR